MPSIFEQYESVGHITADCVTISALNKFSLVTKFHAKDMKVIFHKMKLCYPFDGEP